MKKQVGFTLIELVIVIVILGILAAVAGPKFSSLQSDARIATLEGLEGSVYGASEITHAKSLIAGSDGAASTTVDIATGVTVAIAYGYPAGTAAGIGASVNYDSGTFTVTDDGAGVATFTLRANCTLTYTEAGSSGAQPVIAIDTSGC